MTRLILHIGSHKTGTTAIQQALYDNRHRLRQAGVVYDTGHGLLQGPKTGHHGLAHALASDAPRDREALKRYRERLVTAARTADLVIISAEPFLRHLRPEAADMDRAARRMAYIRRVADYFAGFDVEVSVYLRRPDRFAVSLYKSNLVRTGLNLTFAQYLAARSEIFHYQSRLLPFRQVFDTVTVRCFEAAARTGPVGSFFADHGLPPPVDWQDAVTRQGVSASGALWLAGAKADGNVGSKDLQRRWDFLLSADAEGVLGDAPGTDLWPDNDTRTDFLTQSLKGFDHADFWQLPSEPVRLPSWTHERQSDADDAYRDWLIRNRARLAAREALGAVPYQPDEMLPPRRFRLLQRYFGVFNRSGRR